MFYLTLFHQKQTHLIEMMTQNQGFCHNAWFIYNIYKSRDDILYTKTKRLEIGRIDEKSWSASSLFQHKVLVIFQQKISKD